MAGHVPEVGNPGSRRSPTRRRAQGARRLFPVPQVDSVMMRRMHGREGEQGVEQRVHRLMARNCQGFLVAEAGVIPDLQGQERLRFDVIREILYERFKGADVFTTPARLGTVLFTVLDTVEVG